jgi:hypothetical protein
MRYYTLQDTKKYDSFQIVYLTFDDAFTKLAMETYYSRIFDGQYTNPNGCPITATHFLTHQSTDYALVRLVFLVLGPKVFDMIIGKFAHNATTKPNIIFSTS